MAKADSGSIRIALPRTRDVPTRTAVGPNMRSNPHNPSRRFGLAETPRARFLKCKLARFMSLARLTDGVVEMHQKSGVLARRARDPADREDAPQHRHIVKTYVMDFGSKIRSRPPGDSSIPDRCEPRALCTIRRPREPRPAEHSAVNTNSGISIARDGPARRVPLPFQ
jgi:hypothetical protein